MTQLSPKIKRILASDCNHSMESLIVDSKEKDVLALRALLAPDAAISSLNKSKAIYMLGRLKDRESVKLIGHLLPHLNEKGRINAVAALGNIGSQAALMALVNCENDDSPQVRKFVVHAFHKIEHPYAKAWLKVKKRFDKTAFVRKTAERLLS